MAFLFGRQKTPKEILREHQRSINRAMREIDRERASLQNQEKTIIAEIKKSAKQGQMGAAKIMAKDLVRTRNYVQKFYNMRTQLQAVGLRIQTMKSTQSMAEAMKGCTKAMMMINRQMNLPAMQRIMMEFEQQSEKMDMKEEMMSDALDDVMDGEEDEEKSDDILNQVLDEIGINLQQQLVDTPMPAVPAAPAKESDVDLELQSRLDNLRK